MRYFDLILKSGVFPNFYCSEELARVSGWKEIYTDIEGRFCCALVDENGFIFPPIDSNCFEFVLSESFWAGFSGMNLSNHKYAVFHDYNFIFDPYSFIDMKGGSWAVFRKNVRKFPKRLGGILEYKMLDPGERKRETINLLVEWLKNKGSQTMIENPDEMTYYLTMGKKRAGLFRNGDLIGVNAWDENSIFANYRFILNKDIPFLSEHLRWRFFTHINDINPGKLINDGGSLGNEGIYRFKSKLNPLEIHEIYSLERG
jgi:hypothetical protein